MTDPTPRDNSQPDEDGNVQIQTGPNSWVGVSADLSPGVRAALGATRDSAQLPPLQVDALAQTLFAAWQKTPHSEDDGEYSFKNLSEMSVTYRDAWLAVAREALRTQALTAPNLACKSAQARLATQWGYVRAASVEPAMLEKLPLPEQDSCDIEYSSGHTMGYAQGWNDAIDAGAPPAHIPADVEASPSRALRLAAQQVIANFGNSGDRSLEALYEALKLPRPVAASSPATAVDAVDAVDELYTNVRNAAIRAMSAWSDARDGNFNVGMIEVAAQAEKSFWPALSALQASRQPVTQQAVAEGAGDDSKRLDWLEVQAKESRTGVSIDYVRYVEDGLVLERGYRVMRRHDIGERFTTLRQAIDAALTTKEPRS